jgi:hypothetical protein
MKRIETAANVAVIVVALVVAGALVKRHFLPTAHGGRGHPAELEAGQRIALDGVDWKANQQTLVMVLSARCGFCTQGAPFYQRLAHAAADRGVPVVAVFPHSEKEGKEFLSRLSVPVGSVRRADLDAVKVPGTPTLVLVNREGVVDRVWYGKLPTEREGEVLSALQGRS